MRIAVFTWESRHSIVVGGVAYHVSELAHALERKGHEVHVFTRLGYAEQPWYECIYGVHYHRCPFASRQDFVEEIDSMCAAFIESFLHAERHSGPFDIVHAHDWLTAAVIGAIPYEQRRRSVLTVHSTEYGRCGNVLHDGNSARIRQREQEGVHRADRVIAVSHALKREIEWLYGMSPAAVSVIYNGINYRCFDGWIDSNAVRRMYGIGACDPMILFTGRMVYQKGPDLLLEAMPSVLAFYPKAKCVFVGDGDMRWQLECRARDMGIVHATRFPGYLQGWRLVDLYKATDVVCVPSRNEPFGIVLLESWSAGKPVIATSVGGPMEIVWHDVTGLKVYPETQSIAWGLGTAFHDTDHCRWMGKNGRIAAETSFSWDVIGDEVIKVYAT